jgi:cytochrome b subunit of formate dehydrogenase
MTTPTTTESSTSPPGAETHVRRYNRPARWFHSSTYLVVTVLLGTGWWLRRGGEGEPSFLADLFEQPDTEVHRNAGWALTGVAGVGLTLGIRASWTFVRESLRVDRGDGRWFARWPVGALTGRFAPHRGHFDPGQRLANIAFAGSLGALIVSGIALTTLHGGDTFVVMVKVHRYATYVLTVLVIGHVLVALGILPGYRGVWRAMHWGGRIPLATARRLWPSSTRSTEPTKTP